MGKLEKIGVPSPHLLMDYEECEADYFLCVK
jgi:hypothetical protein